MCDNPFHPPPPPADMVNMAANHVELQHQVSIPPDARKVLSDRIETEPDLCQYLSSQGMSHLDLVHLAAKQFEQGLPHAAPAAPPAPGAAPRPVIDKKAVTASIAQKAWSPLWK